MHTFILSIVFSVLVSVFLKIARGHRIDVAQAIASGYIMAAALCFLLFRPGIGEFLEQSAAAWGVLLALGILLPTIFLVMAAAVEHAGIVLSDTAQRLSLVVPLGAAFLLFGEQAGMKKLAGIGLALCALVCLLNRQAPLAQAQGESGALAEPSPLGQSRAAGLSSDRRALFSLLGVWLGYGTIDILFKTMARLGAQFINTLFFTFLLAMVLLFGWLLLIQPLIGKKTRWDRKSLASGILLGGLNFGNIYFYIRAHQLFPDQPTLVFAAMNIGVISLGALVGAGFFRERLTHLNILGIALAIGAIILLFPS